MFHLYRTRIDTGMYIYQQRIIKSLFDSFQVFFIPEAMQLYLGLELINDQNPFEHRVMKNYEQENMLSVALGQVVLVTLHLSQCLGLSLKYPMIFNSIRSFIIIPETNSDRVLPLYLYSRSDYRTMDLAIKVLGRNLRSILSALERLKDRYGFGKIQRDG